MEYGGQTSGEDKIRTEEKVFSKFRNDSILFRKVTSEMKNVARAKLLRYNVVVE